MCRPHFTHHSPLHPWLANSGTPDKAPGQPQSNWCPPYAVDEAAAKSGLSNPMFSFPPTPPKDATPDSVSAPTTSAPSTVAPSEYSSAAIAHMGVFLHPEHGGSACDIKPMLNNNAAGTKQREGTSSPSPYYQDSNYPYAPYPGYPGHHPPTSKPPTGSSPYSGYTSSSYSSHLLSSSGNHQLNSSKNSQHNAPRTKSRTSAGEGHLLSNLSLSHHLSLFLFVNIFSRFSFNLQYYFILNKV